ncbi:MAG: hypothetical protein V5A46_10000 [Haloferacaceae archaeon]
MSDPPEKPEVVEENAGEEEAADAESEWRFGLDEVGPGADEPEGRAIEPQSINLENALFVALGVLVGAGAILATVL